LIDYYYYDDHDNDDDTNRQKKHCETAVIRQGIGTFPQWQNFR